MQTTGPKPSFCWRKSIGLWSVLNLKERLVFTTLLFLLAVSSIYLLMSFYFSVTEIKPAFGGNYSEGIIGQPRFLNPIYSQASDADRDLVQLLFVGLMTYSSNGDIIPDLAESYQVKEDGKRYEFMLKNAFWSDGKPITADDVVFTIKTLQDSTYQSPLIGSWLGVEVEKLSDKQVAFRLQKPYSAFLELATLKIIPKHIWEGVKPENFVLSERNFKNIVTSGPYYLKKISQDKDNRINSAELMANPKYFGKKPYLKTLTFYFFNDERALITVVQQGSITGFAPQLAKNYILNNFIARRFRLSRYFAIFFNEDKLDLLKQDGVRVGLSYGINKQEIIDKVFNGSAVAADSPVLPESFGLALPKTIYEFNPDKAKELFDKAGFKITPGSDFRQKISTKNPSFQFKSDLALNSSGKEVEELQKCLAQDPKIFSDKITAYFGQQTKSAVIRFQEKYKEEILNPAGLKNGNGKVGATTRAQLNTLCFPKTEEKTELAISITTISESPLLDLAMNLKEQLGRIGVKVNIEQIPAQNIIGDVIRTRNYETLLFGQVLGAIPDPLPFWHSSQKKDPGLNLTSFGSKDADTKLTLAREAQSADERNKALSDFQDILLKATPAIFLVQPDYVYFVSPTIKGLSGHFITDPSKRFINISDWYIKTKRVFK